MWINRLIKKLLKNNQTEVQRNKELEKINTQLNQTNTRLAKLERDLEKAISGYRIALIKENPDILPEMINGENIEDLDRSLITAKELMARIKTKLEAKTEAERIPGGAPARTPPDLENLSPHEKILQGLEKG